MTLLVVVSDLEIGGGQAFAVRLAQALARESRVILTATDPSRVDPRFTARITPDVSLVLNEGGASGIARIVADEGVTAVNSHLWWADKLVYEALRDSELRWVVSMHGCYEMLADHPSAEPGFRDLATAVLGRADRVFIAAEKNRRVFERFGLPQNHVERVPYGFEPKAPKDVRRPTSDIVFGLVSRAVAGKGWEQAVIAFRAVRARLQEKGVSSSLVLVGGGPVADALLKMNEPDVVLPGWCADPEEYIAGFDIALLPSSFSGESFPNAIIEYFAQSKPVIATHWAEIPSMVGEGGDAGGVLIDIAADGQADVAALRDAMIALALDATRRKQLALAASKRGPQFSMPTCAARYRHALTTVCV